MESRTTAEHIQHCGKLLKTKQQQQKHQDLLCYVLKKKKRALFRLFRDGSSTGDVNQTTEPRESLGKALSVTTFKMVIRRSILRFWKSSLGHISFPLAEQFTASSTIITR